MINTDHSQNLDTNQYKSKFCRLKNLANLSKILVNVVSIIFNFLHYFDTKN